MSGSAPIVVLGELALHVFAPTQRPEAPHESLLQLGGGAGMITRHLHQRRAQCTLISVTGGDEVGRWVRGLADQVASATVHAVDERRATSLVYCFIDEAARIWVEPGEPDPTLLHPLLEVIAADAVVYCPVFPGFEGACERAVHRSRFTVLDFGHFAVQGKPDLLARMIESAPVGHLAQINGAGLDGATRKEMLELARKRGFALGYVSAGQDALLGYDEDGPFAINPERVPVACSMGAGDVLVAEVLLALAEDRSFRNGCTAGCRAASAKCRKWGV